MKKLFYLLTLVFLGMTVQSCDSKADFNGSDIITTELRDLSSFNKIEVRGVFRSEIIYSQDSKVEITTNENIHERILTTVTNNNLDLELIDGHYDNIKLDVTIYTDDLELFVHQGVGDQSISGFPKLDFIEIQQAGVGDITISGSADKFIFEGNDVGNLNGFDFIVDDCSIDQNGVGNLEVNCQSNLQGSLTGVGNIYYKGSPKIDVDITGVGKLINAN